MHGDVDDVILPPLVEPDILEVVGIGFGPANLALAIALTEKGLADRALFVERQPSFAWHEGMLIEGSRMQVSFLKDLVTLRNPSSPLSFLSYLHERGRLVDFINAKALFPLRVEFNDYLVWAAEHVRPMVRYGWDAVTIEPVLDADGRAVELSVLLRTQAGMRTLRTRNLVLGIGSAPHLPAGVRASERVWHSSELLHRAGSLGDDATCLVVVGSGQSAAEVAQYLHQRFSRAEVHAVMSRFGYSRSDDSSFTNRIFDPEATLEFYEAPPEVKNALLAYHSNTNYSAVDGDLIMALYDQLYLERVTGRPRFHVANVSKAEVVAAAPTHVEVDVTSLVTGRVRRLTADAIVFATGYEPVSPLALISSHRSLWLLDDCGLPQVTRDFRLVADETVSCQVYLQGPTEHTHGISSTLLSNMAIRAGQIACSIARSLERLPVAR